MKSSDAAAWGLAALLGVAGVAHFVKPGFFDEIVPHALPGPARRWTCLSAVAELACAAGIARPGTRRTGAAGAALVFVAVFPANVQMAIDWRSRPAIERAFAYGRLPLQVPLVVWALRVRSDTPSNRHRRGGPDGFVAQDHRGRRRGR
jgi:uncharacterized membrane protein